MLRESRQNIGVACYDMLQGFVQVGSDMLNSKPKALTISVQSYRYLHSRHSEWADERTASGGGLRDATSAAIFTSAS